ncbi:MAG: hypothetical protein ACAH95_11505 [Fimbriimonas sp.]
MQTSVASLNADQIADELRSFVARVVKANGGSTSARRPAHRVKFHWPPHPISYSFHVLATDWKGKASFQAHGETFDVEVANTPYGVFGRCTDIWHEDRGDTMEEMLANLKASSEPLFQRQLSISRTLELPTRFTGHVRELSALDQLKLLYCEDRDIANEARTEIETHASSCLYFPGLISILDDREHPNRRSAQWCVLDLFESLPDFCHEEDEEMEAVRAMKDLIWSAEDDYARTIYKAGVVLGGHIPYRHGGPTLLECLYAPSKIGRRSAIHGLFHVVEWIPEMRDLVASALERVAANDPEPVLREFAASMAEDIAASAQDHRIEPVFPEES